MLLNNLVQAVVFSLAYLWRGWWFMNRRFPWFVFVFSIVVRVRITITITIAAVWVAILTTTSTRWCWMGTMTSSPIKSIATLVDESEHTPHTKQKVSMLLWVCTVTDHTEPQNVAGPFWFLPHFHIIWDHLLNGSMALWDLLVDRHRILI